MNCFVAVRFQGTALVLTMAAGLVLTHPRAGAQAPAARTDVPAGNAQNGKKLYTSYGCYECHGLEGQGGGAGPRIAPAQIPLAAVRAYVRAPKGQMPPYTSKVVSDSELADIYAFLRSRPQPPPAKSIPLLNN